MLGRKKLSRICREIVLFCAPKRERATDSKPITTFHKFARFGRNLTAISALMVLGENRHLAQFAQNYSSSVSDFVRTSAGRRLIGCSPSL